MALCAIKATPASALPTATCGYGGDPKKKHGVKRGKKLQSCKVAQPNMSVKMLIIYYI